MHLLFHKWQFEGDINNYIAPKLLTSFLKWVIIGSHTLDNDGGDRQKNMEDLVGNVTQLVAQNVKTDRQINYKQQNRSYNKIETPLSIRISMFIYHNTRSKKLINFISDLNIGVNYKKVISIKKAMASSIQKQRNKRNGVFIPTGFIPGKTDFFAIDNIDIEIDSQDGKNQLHGRVIAAYREKQPSMTVENTVGYISVYYKEPLVNQFCHKITSCDVLGG